jgi:hypothetical protein
MLGFAADVYTPALQMVTGPWGIDAKGSYRLHAASAKVQLWVPPQCGPGNPSFETYFAACLLRCGLPCDGGATSRGATSVKASAGGGGSCAGLYSIGQHKTQGDLSAQQEQSPARGAD